MGRLLYSLTIQAAAAAAAATTPSVDPWDRLNHLADLANQELEGLNAWKLVCQSVQEDSPAGSGWGEGTGWGEPEMVQENPSEENPWEGQVAHWMEC